MTAGAKTGAVLKRTAPVRLRGANSEGRRAAQLPLSERDPVCIHPGLALAALRLTGDNRLGAVRTDLDDVKRGLAMVLRQGFRLGDVTLQ